MSSESGRRGERRSDGGPKRRRSASVSEAHPGGSGGGSPGGGSKGLERREQKRKKREVQQIQQMQHLESFYEKLPPGLIKEDETKPEDCIPDVPGNENAREFLAHAPTKGLWMPLGKEVKVMQCKIGKLLEALNSKHSQITITIICGRKLHKMSSCHPMNKWNNMSWRCKRYGHRTGDKECPFFIKGNQKLEQFRVAHEDPMYDIIRENKRHEKEMRIQQLKQLLEDSTSEEDSNSSGSSECKEKCKKKKKKKSKKKKKKKHKSSKSNKSSESD